MATYRSCAWWGQPAWGAASPAKPLRLLRMHRRDPPPLRVRPASGDTRAWARGGPSPVRRRSADVTAVLGFRAKQGAARAGRNARHRTKAGLSLRDWIPRNDSLSDRPSTGGVRLLRLRGCSSDNLTWVVTALRKSARDCSVADRRGHRLCRARCPANWAALLRLARCTRLVNPGGSAPIRAERQRDGGWRRLLVPQEAAANPRRSRTRAVRPQ